MAWHPLVHVCQRWRYLVFASPLRLDLRLICTDSSPVREKLDIWPPLSIKIWSISPNLGDNIIAAFEHPDRIREIYLWSIRSPLDHLVTMMQKPFPELEYLYLWTDADSVPAFPDTFLGGFAPRLRSLHLDRIPFPTLPRLLLSCNDLVSLALSRIPNSGYISPEAMVTSISALTRLSSLFITFDSPASLPDWTTQRQRPPPLTRVVLPTLAIFWFHGVSEYLEVLMARINAPLLHTVDITLVDQLVFHTQQLGQFIGHAPIFMSYTKARMDLTSICIAINFSSIEPRLSSGCLKLKISPIGSEGDDLQVSSMSQICSQLSFLVSRIERLYIEDPPRLLTTFHVNMDTTQWLELLLSFAAVQALYLPYSFLSPIISALNEESVTDILPALVDLYIEGYQTTAPELQDIEPFIAARQRSGNPVTVHRWTR
jgi:hypothetical protein